MGQLGWELQRTLATLGEVVAVDQTTEPLRVELAQADSIRALLRAVKPHWIVNAAAYTAVDRAEAEPGMAAAINEQAPRILAEEADRLQCVMLHFSTDYVFDGAASLPYTEQDAPNPQSCYGRTKLAGEEAIRALGVTHFILRTAWLYGMRGSNFLLTIRRLAGEREELRIVQDQLGSPTWCRYLAEATAQMIAQLLTEPERLERDTGTYHVTASGCTSWHGFAEAIVTALRLSEGLAVGRIQPIATEEYPLPAPRPAYSVLDNRKIRETFGIRLPPWEKGLAQCLGTDDGQ
jgi:dTDP-4-dehydrorhamnose reductase